MDFIHRPDVIVLREQFSFFEPKYICKKKLILNFCHFFKKIFFSFSAKNHFQKELIISFCEIGKSKNCARFSSVHFEQGNRKKVFFVWMFKRAIKLPLVSTKYLEINTTIATLYSSLNNIEWSSEKSSNWLFQISKLQWWQKSLRIFTQKKIFCTIKSDSHLAFTVS